jgi:hypothetical protein
MARLAMINAVSLDRNTQADVITIIVVADCVIGDGKRAVNLGDESDIDLFDISTRRRCGGLNRVSSLRPASPRRSISSRSRGRQVVVIWHIVRVISKLSPLRDSTIMA